MSENGSGTDMASTIFSSPAVCDLADAVDEQLRHRARRREHVCGSITCIAFATSKKLLIGSAEWNLLELGELSRSKVIELNQRCVGQYVSLTRSFLSYNGSLSLTLVNSPPSTCAEWQASIHGGVSHENTTFNSCIGDAAEFDC
jgi:hypothetical protein